MSAEPTATSPFASDAEFREVMDAVFGMLCEDAVMGPRLRHGDVPQRYVFGDLGLALNVRSGRGDEPHICWLWSDEPPWAPEVELTMSSDVANRYFQGRENLPIAIARGRIRAGGNVKAALALMPLTKPVFPRYRELVAARYPHLAL